MALLNKNAAGLMSAHGCHGATDITGFGIKGHAENLAHVQKEAVDFRIDALPVISGMGVINNNILNFKLLEGKSAETSGGLLIMVPPDSVDDFQKELAEKHGQLSWVVGELVPGNRQVIFGQDAPPNVIEVKHFVADDF